MVEPTLFDLWYVLVEVVFGGVFLSGIFMLIVLFIMGALARMSFILITAILVLFTMQFLAGYYGIVIVVLAFVFGIIYLATSIMNFISRYR